METAIQYFLSMPFLFFKFGNFARLEEKMKNAKIYSSYRSITISSVFSKALESLVLPEMMHKCVLNYRLFGFCKHLNCAFAHRLLKCIRSNADN